MKVIKEFFFNAAHQLSRVHDEHKCKRLHGHNYRIRIECQADTLNDKDMVIDFDDIKTIVKPLVEMLDHQNINHVVCYDNTTAEWLCQWFVHQIGKSLPLSAVEVWETKTAGARIDV